MRLIIEVLEEFEGLFRKYNFVNPERDMDY